jgi:hypothetical protein
MQDFWPDRPDEDKVIRRLTFEFLDEHADGA